MTPCVQQGWLRTDAATHSSRTQDSKLANVLFAFELQRRVTAAGLPITANALHPGFIPGSGFWRSTHCCVKCCVKCCCGIVCRPCGVTQSVANGEKCEVYVTCLRL